MYRFLLPGFDPAQEARNYREARMRAFWEDVTQSFDEIDRQKAISDR